MILILIFAEALGLYGLIVALILSSSWLFKIYIFIKLKQENKNRNFEILILNFCLKKLFLTQILFI